MGASKELRRSVLSRRLGAGSPQSSRVRRGASVVFALPRIEPCELFRAKLPRKIIKTLCARSRSSRSREEMACNRAAKSGFAAEAQRKVRFRAKKDSSTRFSYARSLAFLSPWPSQPLTLLPTLTPGYVDSTYRGCISVGRRRAAPVLGHRRVYKAVVIHLSWDNKTNEANVALKSFDEALIIIVKSL